MMKSLFVRRQQLPEVRLPLHVRSNLYRRGELERALRAEPLVLAAIAILARRSPASIKRRIATGSLYRKTHIAAHVVSCSA
jgi:hypothetical protein